MFAQRPLDRRRFFGTVALSMAAAWIGTRESVLQTTMPTNSRSKIPQRATSSRPSKVRVRRK